MKNEHKNIDLGLGPGGINCPCCTDNPHKRVSEKTFYNRKARKKLKFKLLNELKTLEK